MYNRGETEITFSYSIRNSEVRKVLLIAGMKNTSIPKCAFLNVKPNLK